MEKLARKELELQFTEAQNCTVYGTIPKPIVKTLFSEVGVVPTNDFGSPDETYICGDVQFIFNEDSGNLDEVLIFPVYSYDDDLINGESFISAPEWFRDFEDDARAELYSMDLNIEDDGR